MDPDALESVDITPSSGNVFGDLGLPHPEERRLKAELTIRIEQFIEQKGWTQAQAASVIGLTQPQVSLLLRGRLAGFSIDRLLTILNRLGHSIEVRISAEERAPDEARLFVSVA
jgi:predicted XRE-type DNA-binding protein